MIDNVTIVIPGLRHPNFMEICIQALIKNSRYKNKILIVYDSSQTPASDFMYDKNDKKNVYQKYHSMDDFITKRRKWLNDNNVTLVDVTEQLRKFVKEFIEKNPGITYYDGHSIAFKDNIAMDYVDTEWFIWNWDDDFIGAPDWDYNLFKRVDTSRHDRVYTPVHVQPAYGTGDDIKIIDPNNVWDTSKHISIHRLTLPIPSRIDTYLLESELNQFVNANKRDQIIVELCHIRHKTHWLPMLLEKSLYLKAGGSGYKGPGFDVAFDDKLGEMGIMKVMSCDSFIIHRGYMIWDLTGDI